MSIAKVIEVIAEGKTIDDAVQNAASEAGKSVRNVKTVFVDSIQALIDDGKVKKYRVNCKVTFVVD